MRLHRFFISKEIGDSREITIHDSDLEHQLRNVFRFTTGGQVILFDNSGNDFHVLISAFGKGSVTFGIIRKSESKNIPSRELYLYCSILKKDNFEWVLEKGTELGVTKFIPLVSDRSEKKNINYERAEKILKEASEQSGRSTLPVLEKITSLDEVISLDIPLFAFHLDGDVFTIEHTHTFSPLGVLIGPEGGWTEREIHQFKQQSIKVYSMGNTVLRAETAAIAVSSLILLQ